MAKSEKQKLKLLYLADMLARETDDTHALRVQDMIDKLDALGIKAERKSIYSDLLALEEYGLDIVAQRGKTTSYALAHRTFELPELKLLVDAVQSSKFLSQKKSRELISKIESLASRHEASDLQRQVYVTNRVKSMNESIYYTIDMLHAAINANRQITFRYVNWTVQKTQELRRGGAPYTISPYALVWDDENYYLVGYESETQQTKHYRVDKMQQITTTNTPRAGQEMFRDFDMALYTKKMFGMFNGEEEALEIRFAARLAGVVIDRFGKDAVMLDDGDSFRLHIRAVPSPQLFGWVASFGTEAKILAPQAVAAQFADNLRAALAQYE